MQVQHSPAVVALCQAIFASIDTGESGIENPANWPASAEFAVEYTHHDRQFPQVRHDSCMAFFDTQEQLIFWVAEQKDFVKGTDYDFTVRYSVYTWDLGPEFQYSKEI